MKLKIFTLCDFAKDYNGQLCINGTFNILRTPVLPSLTRSMCLACQFELCDNVQGTHDVSITLTEKKTGNVMIDEKLRLQVGVPASEADKMRRLYTNLVLNLENIIFPSDGTYEFKVTSDDSVDTLEMYVEYIPQV